MYKLDDALDRISDGIIAYDRELRVLYMNRAAEAYTGFERAALVSKLVLDVLPKARGSFAVEQLQRALESQQVVEFETKSPVYDKWVASRVYPSPDGLVVYFCDITERKRVEEALAASEERYRAIVANSLLPFILATKDGRILYANPAACAALRRTETEVRGAGRQGVVDTSDPRFGAFLEERSRTGRARGELTMRRGDGTTFAAGVAAVVYRDARGEELTTLSFEDLTERKRGEEALAILAEAAHALGTSLDCATSLERLAHVVVPRLCDVYAAHVVGDPPVDPIVHAAFGGDENLNAFRRVPRPGAARGPVHVMRSAQHELVPVVTDDWLRAAVEDDVQLEAARALGPKSILVVPIQRNGVVLGALTFASLSEQRRYDTRDVPLALAIADRAAVAIENARKHEEAVAAKRLRDEVLGVVAHDLRNPLNGILLNARALERRLERDGIAPSEEIDSIRDAVSRADRLIHDLLLTSMIEGGKLPLDRQRIDVHALVSQCVADHARDARDRSIALTARIGEDVKEAFVDRHRILQLLDNLVSNALKFTKPGGKVEVAARTTGARLVLSVADDGVGIPPEQLGRVFDRFWQAAHARNAGAGLGLAIVRGIAEAHGGEVSVRSVLGEGSTFRVSLPLRAEDVSAVAWEETRTSSAPRR